MNTREVGYSYLDELNDIQRQAVTTLDGPVMVIAGPGSGKTRVLTYRIAHLINTGVPPWQILSLTFTNKAAREMKERIEKVVGGAVRKVWAGTFHSIFARILRVEAHRIGFPNDFTIYDTDDSRSLLREIIGQMNLDKKVYPASAVHSRISSAKSNLITPKAYAQNEDLVSYDRMNRRPLIHQIYEKYANRCKRAGAMDFDDLLLQMFRLLYQNPDNVRVKYQSQFQYLLVDEFQDTNYLQYEILKLLLKYPESRENVCIVGDDAQSIYSFRGATIENILMFEKDFNDVKVFKLEQNYRSTHHIVEAANGVINYNKRQIQKKIWTDHQEGNKIKLIKAVTETDEGRRVADSIIEQKNRYHYRNNEIAILYRTNAQSRVFEESLRRQNIPYRIYGGTSFYNRKEVKDVLGYMRLVVNSKDDEALKRVINYPRRGVGKTTIGKLQQIAEEHNISLWEVLTQTEFKGRGKKGMVDFVALIRQFKQKAQQANAYDVATSILSGSGIMSLLKADNTIEGLGRIENVEALMNGVKQFVEDDELEEGEEINTDRSLAAFLQTISLMTDADVDDPDTDVVTMMSVHAAKGLEYKSVFVVGLEENLFPSYMSMNSPDQIEEERRLFYVAITRAEQMLCLSFATTRYQYGNVRMNDPSRFLEEISEDNLDNIISITKPGPAADQPDLGFGPPKKLTGNFRRLSAKPKGLSAAPTDFTPAEPHKIKEGMRIRHMKFGEGLVKTIDERDVATIFFEHIEDNQEKRIMLQYSKLEIIGG